jgi:hypothetical protein
VPDGHDKSLNAALAEIASRLAGSVDDYIDLDADIVRSELVGLLIAAGMVARAPPSRSIVCDGCDRGCSMPVEIVARDNGLPSQNFVVCDKRDDIGRVSVDPVRLLRWRVSLARIAEIVAALLNTDRTPASSSGGRSWNLGHMQANKQIIEVALDPDARAVASTPGLTITLDSSAQPAGRYIWLPRLVGFKGHVLGLNRAALKHTLRDKFDDSRVACEIRLERGDVVLIDHLSGLSRVLASPQLNSSNDNAFQVLYDNPGRRYSLGELRDAARDKTIDDLHKMVENLRFDGVLKKLFFRVSKSAICFDRTATLGQLVTLGIDPKEIS